jgi:hypothetical protein
MGSVLRFRLRARETTSTDLDANDVFRQRVMDCLRNGKRSGSDVFDEMVARIRVARCYMPCDALSPRFPEPNGICDLCAQNRSRALEPHVRHNDLS